MYRKDKNWELYWDDLQKSESDSDSNHEIESDNDSDEYEE